jgi:hypothetical protein
MKTFFLDNYSEYRTSLNMYNTNYAINQTWL